MPKEFTYQELGTLLSAVGEIMASKGLCAGAVMDGSDDDLLTKYMMHRGIDPARAKELLEMDLIAAVEYIEEN